MSDSLKFARVFEALGSEQRLEIVRLLLKAGAEGLTVGQIQAKLEIPSSTLSHHLEKLRREGLVDARRDRQCMWHFVNLEMMGRLVAFLCARCYKPDLIEPLFNRIQTQCTETSAKGMS